MRFLTTLLIAGLALAAAPPGAAVPGTGTVRFAADKPPADAGLRRLLEDYVGLYRADRLADWKRLLHERVSVADPRPDGTIRFRGLEEFFTTQQGFFASGRRIGERLEEVQAEEGRRIARVSARFVFVDGGEERPGRLGLHVVEEGGTWRIVAIVFSYDKA
ncbi:MAG TPA: nuclear transport factor 2 family protein [Candidatus Polarisedimenticolia bacterium]|nr:nuclear transport factor 2 family protein [Candidatus Polarisedimenticolia bacterium]